VQQQQRESTGCTNTNSQQSSHVFGSERGRVYWGTIVVHGHADDDVRRDDRRNKNGGHEEDGLKPTDPTTE
jgi:hypothetical protein